MTSTSGGGGAGVGLSEHPANMSRAAPSAAPRRFLKYLAECIDILPDTELTYNALQRLRDGQVAAVSLSIDTAPITGFSTAECNISYNSTYFQKDNQSETIRSEEHTSELQSIMRISYAVFCLKKNRYNINTQLRENSTTTDIKPDHLIL